MTRSASGESALSFLVVICTKDGVGLVLSLPKVINVKFLLQSQQKHYITQYEELDFLSLSQMKDDYTTNSHYPLTYTFISWKVGRVYFLNLGVKGLNCGITRKRDISI